MKISRNNFQKNQVPNMNMKSIREKIEKVKPHFLKVASDTLQGYAFGCMVGVFSSSKKPTLSSIHESGKSFAKISLVYSTTESSLQLYGSENAPLNSFISGVVAGGLGVNDKSKRTIFAGAASFGLYTGMSSAFSVRGQK
ncbi:translocase Tim22/17-like protein [Encephalitozoon romaleae SJ-2008]|uniref:Translocase Tim22/17-like protein n=1 Tax=Encephalitozoon romaleae (strain SJ-2008) TaxID=1178016 RepID=I6ZJ66_ENCRO|nr:translocase Tim22/17-like protein [Encephalitozoon romaleae SJ-2008]AFN83268.1 translocase Tim22/17-like protein [Encephalitozoon romaleae SJ-2008]